MIQTVLAISGVGIVPFSDRKVRESLRPIQQGAQVRRTVNGLLVNNALPQFRKYAVEVSGADVQPAALDNVWVGQDATVSCVTELAVKVNLVAGVATVYLGRTPVAGAGRAIWRSGLDVDEKAVVAFSDLTAGWVAQVTFTNTARTGEAFILYRPQLECLVTGFQSDTEEGSASPAWSVQFEEK